MNGLPITTIGKEAFAGRNNLFGITTPDSVVAIGKGAYSALAECAKYALLLTISRESKSKT